ncbi:alpha/beta hydrolase [Leucobacter albus]|uniref:Alpha/beta hydrolase n=1 Tax=Leucobacter albus TaxID=272210 RepID=A0ABW3TKS5_9MICO
MIDWRPDVLGDGFEQLTFELGIDDDPGLVDSTRDTQQGPLNAHQLVATLVRSLPEPLSWWNRLTGRQRGLEDVDVLYVHGWSDYFFQADLARFWTLRGARFFALDLRRYGRSLRPGQTAGYIADLGDYDAEIDFALAEMRASAPRSQEARKLVLLGHSTGGLVLSLWASRHPGIADALVLNSPWLELQLSARGRQMIAPIVNLGAKYSPLEGIPQLDYGFYARAVRTVGPASDVERINTEWKPEQSHPVHAGWLRAILAGHDSVYRGLNIEAPVCVLLSRRSALPTRWSEELTRADSVLDVDDISRAALRLGPSVTVERIDGALHDVFVSGDVPRADAYARLGRFAQGWRCALD